MNDINLACFLSVARTLNFSVSARNLSMTQQAVSRNIQKLEDELGVSLINRNSQAVMLTWAGEQFAEWCRAYDSSLAYAGQMVTRDKDCICLGWGDWSGCPEEVEAAIRTFQQAWPQVEVSFRQGSHQEILSFLREGIVDMAFLPTRCVPFYADLLTSFPVLSLPLYAVTSARNPILFQEGFQLELLSAMPELVPPLMLATPEGPAVGLISELFECPLPPGPIQRVANVNCAYTGLIGSTCYTISPANRWVKGQPSLALLSIPGATVQISAVRLQQNQNLWADRLFEYLPKERDPV